MKYFYSCERSRKLIGGYAQKQRPTIVKNGPVGINFDLQRTNIFFTTGRPIEEVLKGF
jgi:hypothetical protein